MFRPEVTSNNPGGCNGTEMSVKFNVATENTEYYIAMLPSEMETGLLEVLENTPNTRTPIQVVSGEEYKECLDPKKLYLLVITDSSGGLEKIDKDGKGSWVLTFGDEPQKLTISDSQHVQSPDSSFWRL